MQLKNLGKNKNNSFLNASVFPILLLIIFLIVYRTWIFDLGVLTHTDWWFYSHETMNSILIHIFSVWFVDFTLGRVLLEMGQAPIYIWYGILPKVFGFDYAFVERLIHFWPIIIVTPLSAYIFLKSIFKRDVACFIGVLVYSFNTYFLTLQTGHITLMAAAAFVPLILYLFRLTLEQQKFMYALLTGTVLFICSSYEPRVFYLVIWIMFFHTLYHTVFVKKKFSIKSFIVTSMYAFIPLMIVLLLSAFWILGLSQTASLQSNELFRRELFGNEFFNIPNAFTLFHPFWTGSKSAVFELQSIPFFFWIIPCAAFLGLFLNRKNSTVLFFGFICILGIFLAKQIGQPFPGVYPFLYDYLPGFNAFREASKFYIFIVIGYTVLIAGFIQWLYDNWNTGKWKIYAKYSLTIVIASVFLWNTKPILTGEIGTLFVTREMPNDYKVVKDYVLSQDSYFRTLSIPTFSRWSPYTNEHPQLSTVSMMNTYWNSLIKDKQKAVKYTEAELMIAALNTDVSDNLLDKSSIKYVIVPLIDKANDDNFFIFYGRDREYYIRELNKIDYLKKVDVGTQEVLVYENHNYRPHIYITNEKESLKNNVPIQQVDFTFVRPSEYTITLDNVSDQLYLTFTDAYHPSWEIIVGKVNWFDSIQNENYFLSDKNHLKSEAGLNTFIIDPKEICKNSQCTINSDGSYTLNVTLYFKPQAYVYLGGIISLATLGVLLGYFILLWFKKARYGNEK